MARQGIWQGRALHGGAEHALEPLTRKGDEEEFCECFKPKP